MAEIEYEGVTIEIPDDHYFLRPNKQSGVWAIGTIPDGDEDAMSAFSRGKWIEFSIINISQNFQGRLDPTQPGRVFKCLTYLITDAEDSVLKGMVAHSFISTEVPFFTTLQTEGKKLARTNLEQGVQQDPFVIRWEFPKKKEPNKMGGSHYRPILSKKMVIEDEARLMAEAAALIAEQIPQVVPEIPELFPATYEQNGQLQWGMLPLTAPAKQLPVLQPAAKMPVLSGSTKSTKAGKGGKKGDVEQGVLEAAIVSETEF